MSIDGQPGPRRAPRLTFEARRDAILDAVSPLLLERGPSVTTKELAAAAGVAEGTLFRVFPDKAALLREAVRSALDPHAAMAQLGQISLDLPLRTRLASAVRGAARHAGHISAWLTLLHQIEADPHSLSEQKSDEKSKLFEEQRRHLRRLLEPDASSLRVDLDTAVDMVDLLLTGSIWRTMSGLRGAPPLALSPDEIADLLLAGLLPSTPTVEG